MNETFPGDPNLTVLQSNNYTGPDEGGCFRQGPGKLPRPPGNGGQLILPGSLFPDGSRKITLRVMVGILTLKEITV